MASRSDRGPGVRFARAVYDRAKAAAIAEGMPLTRLVEEALSDYVDSMEADRGRTYAVHHYADRALPRGRPKEDS